MSGSYVYSTLAGDQLYTNYGAGGADLPRPRTVDGHEGVLIKGGAGLANKHFVTPSGTVTKVSEEQLAYLGENPVFQQHVAGGFITVEGSLVDAEVVANNMNPGDESKPLTDADFADPEGKGLNVPTVETEKDGKKAGTKAGAKK